MEPPPDGMVVRMGAWRDGAAIVIGWSRHGATVGWYGADGSMARWSCRRQW